jgi:hypothetical protein
MRRFGLSQDNTPTFASGETSKTMTVIRQNKLDTKKLPPIYCHVICLTIDGFLIGK